jgi:hypothetical protein
LKERLSSSDFNQRAAIFLDALENVLQAKQTALVEGMGRIAPGTAGVANSQAHEDARQPGKGGFPLDAPVDFMH